MKNSKNSELTKITYLINALIASSLLMLTYSIINWFSPSITPPPAPSETNSSHPSQEQSQTSAPPPLQGSSVVAQSLQGSSRATQPLQEPLYIKCKEHIASYKDFKDELKKILPNTDFNKVFKVSSKKEKNKSPFKQQCTIEAINVLRDFRDTYNVSPPLKDEKYNATRKESYAIVIVNAFSPIGTKNTSYFDKIFIEREKYNKAEQEEIDSAYRHFIGEVFTQNIPAMKMRLEGIFKKRGSSEDIWREIKLIYTCTQNESIIKTGLLGHYESYHDPKYSSKSDKRTIIDTSLKELNDNCKRAN